MDLFNDQPQSQINLLPHDGTVHYYGALMSQSQANDYLNKLEELRARYVDSTNSGFTESAKIKLSQLNKEINELYVKKIKNQETSVDIGNLSKSSDYLNNPVESVNESKFYVYTNDGDKTKNRKIVKKDLLIFKKNFS